MATIGYFKHNDELYYVKAELQLFQRDNKKVVTNIKENNATIYDLFFISFIKYGDPYYSSISISSDEDLNEMTKEFIGLKSVVDRLEHIVKYETIENIEMFIKQDLNPVEQDVEELQIKITGPKYHLQNLCQLFKYMNYTEMVGGYMSFDLLYNSHSQKVEIDIMNEEYKSSINKSYGNNVIDDGVIRIFDHETGKYKKEFISKQDKIKMDI